MATKKKLLEAAAGSAGGAGLNVEEVFASHLYVGTGDSTQNTIVNGIDLDSEGGMVWTKSRTNTYNNTIGDSHSGLTKYLYTNTNATHTDDTNVYYNSFNSNGYTVGQSGVATANELNNLNQDFVSWTWRKAEKWFDIVSWTGNGVAGRQIPHSLGCEVGMIIMKCTSTAIAWQCYHRSLGNTKQVAFSQQNVPSTTTNAWNDTSPTDTHFTVGTGNNTLNRTYVAYIFAHHDDDGGFGPNGDMDAIKCGTYTTDGSENATIDLGFEPQWLLVKRIDGAGGAASYDWRVIDNMREFTADGNIMYLAANQATAEQSLDTRYLRNATGFQQKNLGANREYIYMAIRRGPMATPDDAADVFDVLLRSGNGTETDVTGVGFAPDLFISRPRTGSSGRNTVVADRLRGFQKSLSTRSAVAEQAESDGVLFFGQDGVTVGASTSGYWNGVNYSGDTLAYYFWKRAAGYFDMVAYSGNSTAGRTVTHNLGVSPEMIWVKVRNLSSNWVVWHTGKELYLSSTAAKEANPLSFNNTDPTDTSFTLNSYNSVNGSSYDYIAYLFASVDGVSKVGSYTGTGAAQNIDCGFSSGARFILVKRTDSADGWFVHDTERGIVTGNDPYLQLNTSDAEGGAYDIVDPYSAGFTVNNFSGWNASGGSYIFYAIA
jgi:hypothetical protein